MLKKKMSFKDLHVLDTGLSLGWQISLPVVVFSLIGVALDNFLKLKPILTIIFILIGIFLSMYSAVIAIRKLYN